MKRNKERVYDILLYSIFLVYIIILFIILFMRVRYVRSYNIIPFQSIGDYLFSDDIIIRSFALSNLLGNIVLFIPLGGYITLFNRNKHIGWNLLRILVIGIVIEAIQYVSMRGVADIDDLILYGIGGIIGIVVYHILLLFFKDVKRVRHVVALAAPVTGTIFFLALFLYNL